ncbi:hypothetical protein E1A91_D12G229000v1 [Gossypium mustelinum]|uniref:DUF7610 domain-containing protein n=1 Tax=Gossypium mustelinum TaxID=34275 RepID=A0A5D2SI34_GOSMU|nr:hypothetical protein E1A91_D12G229000v1 [Gossypium mustelinum]
MNTKNIINPKPFRLILHFLGVHCNKHNHTAANMTKRYTILQKKLKELESQLKQVNSLPLDTPHHHRFSQDIQQRFLFLNNLLSAEISCRPKRPFHLQPIAKRLHELEAAFRDWDTFRSPPSDHVEKGPPCSCTGSCFNDEGEAASELISLSDLEQAAEASTELSLAAGLECDGFSDQVKVVEHVPVHEAVENHNSTATATTSVVEMSLAENRKEETKGVWLGKCLATMASGVLMGMALMGFLMVRFLGCFHCFDSTDYTFCPSPT